MSEPSTLERSYEKMTSSALNGVPSWNLTLWRRLKRHTVGAVCFHDVASSGMSSSFLPRPTSGSYTLPRRLSCSDSLSECGSIETASPWSAYLNVAACAPLVMQAPSVQARSVTILG